VKIVASLLVVAALAAGIAPARASARFADPQFAPIEATAATPVVAHVLVYECFGAPTVEVTRSGNVIQLGYEDAGSCPIDPIPAQAVDVSLGTLPAASYDVRIVATNQPLAYQIQDEAILDVQQPDCGADALCLVGGRFAVTATWTDYTGRSGVAHPVPLSDETGSFWFFTDTNYELMVKVLDGCALNDHFWVYAGGLTDVRVDLVVTDRLRLPPPGEPIPDPPPPPAVREYTNALGHAFAPVDDSSALFCGGPPSGSG